MVGRQRKSRSASVSVEASAGSKRNADDKQEAMETAEPPRKKKTLHEDDEPTPEPTDQQVTRLERKVQELSEENERLKEQVEQLKEQEEQKPKKKAKAQPTQPKAQPKRKAAKAQPKGKGAKT